jgi:hypothetical protein
MTTFGASAPLKKPERKFGFEPERILEVATSSWGDHDRQEASPEGAAGDLTKRLVVPALYNQWRRVGG